MAYRFLPNPLGGLSAMAFLATLALMAYQTPILTPAGFPHSAKPSGLATASQKPTPPIATFVDRTLEKGLNFVHQQGDDQLAGIDEALGPGACAADFNNDGWTDLFLVNGSGHTRYYGKTYWWQSSQGNRLFLNQNGQTFHDATADSGLGKEMWGMGCLANDFDNDGDADLLVTGKEALLLYQNNGDGTFADITANSGIKGGYWSTSAAAADFNGDGLLDIYLGNFIQFQKGKKTFEANSQFMGEKGRTFDASLYEAQPNQLYLNTGGLKFKEMAAQAGVNDAEGKTLDVSWQDINSDGLPDLLVTNERGTGSNTAFLNRGDGEHFDTGGQTLGLRSALGNRGIASGDLDNDGDMDWVLASPAGENTMALIKAPAMAGNNPPSPAYKDQAREMGIGDNVFLGLSAWTPLIQDFNNDGFNDLFIVAGQTDPDPDTAKLSQGQAKQLLLNNGQVFFTDATATAGIALQDSQSARGAVAADFDNDGDIDLYIAHNNDLGQYLANESPPKHWLGLKLMGTPSNRDAIGATVQLALKQGIQTRTVVSGEGFLSDGDKRLVFGLGDQTHIDPITIQWPDGRQQTVHPPQIDRYWQIEENRNDQVEWPSRPVNGNLAEPARLKLGAEQPELRARYLNLLEQYRPDGPLWPELRQAGYDTSPLVRHQAIRIASRSPANQGLPMLTQGLEDPEPANVIAAIEGLRLYEDETAVRWLLRQFAHPDASVKIAVANLFAFFFQEEEAVIHRKYLAVPYLIRMLDDPEPTVRAAAAQALANAERFRGVHALLGHLQDPDPDARAEIVRCLGLIRQTQALPAMNRLITDANQPAKVMANAFIALKRLGDDGALTTLASFVAGQHGFEAIPAAKRLAVLAALLAQDNEATVFDLRQLGQIAQTAFKRYPPPPATATANVTDNALTILKDWLTIQEHTQDPSLLAWLNQQTFSPSASLRALAFQAIVRQNQAASVPLLRRAWSDQDLSIQRWALATLLRNKTPLTADDYLNLTGNPEFRAIALQIWGEQGVVAEPQAFIQALGWAASRKDSPEPISAHGTGKPRPAPTANPPANAPAGWQANGMAQLCLGMSADWQAFCPLILFADATPEHRDMALKLLRGSDYPLGIRQAVLERYDVGFDPDALNVVYAIAQTKRDPLHIPALRKLFSFASDSLLEYAKKIANSASESPEIRFLAVEFLIRRGHTEAWDSLYH